MNRRIVSAILAAVLLSVSLLPAVSAEGWFGEEHEHSYFSYIKTDPTCTESGEEVFECDCGDSYSEAVLPLGHDFADGVCVRCGAAAAAPENAPSDGIGLPDLPETAEEAIPETVEKAVPKGAGTYPSQRLTLAVSRNAKASVYQTDTLVITSGKPVAEWKTSKADVASVSPDGDTCTVTANRVGSAKITAVLNGRKKIVISLTVKDPYLPTGVSFDLAGYSGEMVAGETQSLSGALKLEPAWASTVYTWKSSNKKVLKVDADGNVTALKAGKAKITATAKNRKKATVAIEVRSNRIDGICAAPEKSSAASVTGSWTMRPKAVEIVGETVICEFYLVNGTSSTGTKINGLNLTVALGSKNNVLASQYFPAVKAAVKKNAVKTIKVKLTENVNPAFNLSEWSADAVLYSFDTSAVTLEAGKQAVPFTQTVIPNADYDIDNGVIVGYSGAGGRIAIPAKDPLGNPITAIGQNAFAGTPLSEVRIPEGVVSIGSKAFANTGLGIVDLPRSVRSIAADAFQGCGSLKPYVYQGSYADQWCKSRNITAMRITGLGVDAHTREEIRAFVSAHPAETASRTSYRRAPSLNPSVPGLISEKSAQNAINMVNQIRYIAGLDADVKNDPDLEEMMAAAAMANGLNRSLSHFPTRPSAWADSAYDELYDMALIGASSSNLSAGRENLADSVLSGYMYDSDSYNISCVGHRRWVLNPPMKKTAFGYYSDGSGWKHYSGMYAFDFSGSGNQAPVAWPAQQTPVSRFPDSSSCAWSVSFGYRLPESEIHVRLVRKSDGKTWNFSDEKADGAFYVDNDGYGMEGCVIFRPSGIGKIAAGDSFDVSVTNDSDHTVLRYTVSFFKL